VCVLKTIQKLLLVHEGSPDAEFLQSVFHMIGCVMDARQVSIVMFYMTHTYTHVKLI